MPPADLRPVRRLRCESCLAILSTRHPWDQVSCRCGALTASGPPWRPRVFWIGGADTGWSDVTDLEATAAEDDAGPQPEGASAGDPDSPDADRRQLAPLGFGGRLR